MSIASVEAENRRLHAVLADALSTARVPGDPAELASIVDDVLRLRSGLASLAPAMARTQGLPPGIARAAQATENAWQAIEREFGLLPSLDVAELIGSSRPNRTLANTLRQEGKLLAVKRLNAYRYPGFQFDPLGRIRPNVQALVALSREIGWAEEDLILWLCAPSGTFDGDRPVDHFDDPDLVDLARETATVEW